MKKKGEEDKNDPQWIPTLMQIKINLISSGKNIDKKGENLNYYVYLRPVIVKEKKKKQF